MVLLACPPSLPQGAEDMAADSPRAVLPAAQSNGRSTRDSRHSRESAASTGRASCDLSVASLELERPDALKDLKLGPMLGQGSFGKVGTSYA